jgi:hypothetical protein
MPRVRWGRCAMHAVRVLESLLGSLSITTSISGVYKQYEVTHLFTCIKVSAQA